MPKEPVVTRTSDEHGETVCDRDLGLTFHHDIIKDEPLIVLPCPEWSNSTTDVPWRFKQALVVKCGDKTIPCVELTGWGHWPLSHVRRKEPDHSNNYKIGDRFKLLYDPDFSCDLSRGHTFKLLKILSEKIHFHGERESAYGRLALLERDGVNDPFNYPLRSIRLAAKKKIANPYPLAINEPLSRQVTVLPEAQKPSNFYKFKIGLAPESIDPEIKEATDSTGRVIKIEEFVRVLEDREISNIPPAWCRMFEIAGFSYNETGVRLAHLKSSMGEEYIVWPTRSLRHVPVVDAQIMVNPNELLVIEERRKKVAQLYELHRQRIDLKEQMTKIVDELRAGLNDYYDQASVVAVKNFTLFRTRRHRRHLRVEFYDNPKKS